MAGTSWLDVKLALRMMARHPGLTLVGGVAVAVAVAISAAWFEFTQDMFNPALPLEGGDRVVAIQNWDPERAAPDLRSLRDFDTWRSELSTIEDLGASSAQKILVSTGDGRATTVPGARISATAFRLARVQPARGRFLSEDDEKSGATPVAVIGYDLWQRLFDGKADALGRTVRLGNDGTPATIVGIMPRGFGFPVNQELWIPLQENPLLYGRRDGPPIRVFGRLAPGRSLEEAQAELTAMGQRTAAGFPDGRRPLDPRVESYVDSFAGRSPLLLSAMNIPLLLLLIVICANVSTLVFARTATRRRELVTRSALGASRRRLVGQLFVEALVLTSLAAAMGLALASWGMESGMGLFWEIQQSKPAFWFDSALSVPTILYTMALAVVAAGFVGVLPAIKATGRDLRSGLSQSGMGGTRLRFGVVSTTMIVVQVALCVVFLPVAAARALDATGDRPEANDFPANEYLSGRLTLRTEARSGAFEGDAEEPSLNQAAELRDEVRRRLSAEPGVRGVAYTNRLPGMNHAYEWVRLESSSLPADSAIETVARALAVDLEFFGVMDAPIVAGRGFQPADLGSDIGAAIVDQSFVQEMLGGRNPVGQRLSYPNEMEGEGQRWFEIVGVVQDLGMNAYGPGGYQDLLQMHPAGYVGVYHPLRPEDAGSVQIFVRTDGGNADVHVPRVASTVAAVDPRLAVEDLMTLEDVWRPAHRGERIVTSIMALVTALVVGLSAAGIYALTSFAVAQRTREIGVRAALGADPRRIIVTIFSRAMAQIGAGILIGGSIFALVGVQSPRSAWIAGAMAALMIAVGLFACILPAARAIRIEPTEALRADV